MDLLGFCRNSCDRGRSGLVQQWREQIRQVRNEVVRWMQRVELGEDGVAIGAVIMGRGAGGWGGWGLSQRSAAHVSGFGIWTPF